MSNLPAAKACSLSPAPLKAADYEEKRAGPMEDPGIGSKSDAFTSALACPAAGLKTTDRRGSVQNLSHI